MSDVNECVYVWEADEVLAAWDTLVRDKVPATVVVANWSVEWVARKIGDRSAGDCYAKLAGRPRVRSRVALVRALGLAIPAMDHVAADEHVLSMSGHDGILSNAHVHEEEEVQSGHDTGTGGPEAVGGVSNEDTGMELNRGTDGPDAVGGVSNVDAGMELNLGTDGPDAVGDTPTDETDAVGGGVGQSPEEAPAPSAKRPKWLGNLGGFPDGETSLSPPKAERRARFASARSTGEEK